MVLQEREKKLQSVSGTIRVIEATKRECSAKIGNNVYRLEKIESAKKELGVPS
jgi:hypothetical protein